MPLARDPKFIGREDILARLESAFGDTTFHQRAALYGLGGIGYSVPCYEDMMIEIANVTLRKSQIAIEYAYRLKQKCPLTSTLWVYASNKAQFEASYAEIATRANLYDAPNPKIDALQLVYEWLTDASNGHWLLILDSADDRDMLFHPQQRNVGVGMEAVERRLIDFIPRVSHGIVLITTRDRTSALNLIEEWTTPIEVEAMCVAESVDLLRNRIPMATDSDAVALVNELERLPLAISHAGAYIRKNSHLMSIQGYLAEFRKSRANQTSLLNDRIIDSRRDFGVPHTVLASFEMSFLHIREVFPKSADLLCLMCLFVHESIPQYLLQNQDDFTVFCKDMEPLLNFSLVKVRLDMETFEMHRLVQISMRDWIEMNGVGELWENQAMNTMLKFLPDRHDGVLAWLRHGLWLANFVEVIQIKFNRHEECRACVAQKMKDSKILDEDAFRPQALQDILSQWQDILSQWQYLNRQACTILGLIGHLYIQTHEWMRDYDNGEHTTESGSVMRREVDKIVDRLRNTCQSFDRAIGSGAHSRHHSDLQQLYSDWDLVLQSHR